MNPSTKIDTYVYQFNASNPPVEDEQALRLFKGHLMQSKQQQLLEFWMWREHVIELCKHPMFN